MSLWELQIRQQQGDFLLDLDCKSDARVLGLFGPSGSGKTTCLECIAGLRPAEGHISCMEQVWLHSAQGCSLKPEQRQIGYVPQEHLLFPHLNAEQNLRFGAPGTNDHSLFDEVVQVLELQDLLSHRIDQLSGGQRQRVALGRALCSQPRMLMFDEPLASLDVGLRQRILPFLKRVRQQFNLPILIVSHDPFELQALCDEVIVLQQGKATAQGTPCEVFTSTEIYSTLSKKGYRNVLPATLIEQRKHSSRVRLGDSGPELTILKQDLPLGASLTVGLPASDILIATQVFEGLSARNSLPAITLRLEHSNEKVLLTADLLTGLPPLLAELTPDSVEDLEIIEGKTIQFIIKSSSVEIY
ncbi:molybdenum ABC transporter ATP-binding protein [Coraliomargarita akajimensis]|uniref:Molybdate ABC transporter, ATPase subunit n=1 Tax=Coraliomargarita akajimensis (strain DSM 45221 / IAM 15411 / JCM 23193 / KCTC 12865 / 04OKA010-24) TaxID=583355 RepID=D5EKT6_CORAD|nr:molybdenum ABC transporter ATP-binding protein [Coraliomargarita akajimensis]ADE54993.1 molybdate ABC transporter, ATPase subunit [Coraliomargarita akajimensis DSM 45221]